MKLHKSLFVLLVVVGIALASFFIARWVVGSGDQYYAALAKKYPLLSERILRQNENDLLIHFVPLRKQLRQQVGQYGDTFSVYFEYLPTGINIGVNEKVEYDVASLLKVPLVMAYYNQQEGQGLAIDQSVTITQDQLDSRFGTLWQRGVGATVRLAEAAKLALVDSDNTAAIVLAKHVHNQDYQEVYNGLDIELPKDESNPVKLSAKGYGSILKALYFSSILSRDDSQTILGFLTQTQFTDKLPAGVPAGIPVAHKIGVLDGQVYHDCGIIYEPQRPYLLCLFSRSNEEVARARMKTISALIYDYIHTVR